jgi:hypothetical protein
MQSRITVAIRQIWLSRGRLAATLRPSIVVLSAVVIFGLAGEAAASAGARPTVHEKPHCNRVAAPNGDDRNAGTVRSPYRTFSRLANSLRPDMVGCLRSGVYGDKSTTQNVERGGRSGHPVVITAYPNERPTIAGSLVITSGADYVTLSHVAIDGANDVLPGGKPQSMVVLGNHFVLEDSDLTNHNAAASGILIKGDSPLIRRNRIHDVGANFGYDHGIYVADSHEFTIQQNWIYDCRSGWGLQLYPHAVHGTVAQNVIDSCGSGITIGGEGDEVSTDNRIVSNLITNSTGLGRFNRGTAVAGCCGDAPVGNVVSRNVFWANTGGNFDSFVGRSYLQDRNASFDPHYINLSEKNFRVRTRAATALGLWNGVRAPAPIAVPRGKAH